MHRPRIGHKMMWEVLRDVLDAIPRVQLSPAAARPLVAACESRMTEVFVEALRCARHGKRDTVTARDVALAMRVMGYRSSTDTTLH